VKKILAIHKKWKRSRNQKSTRRKREGKSEIDRKDKNLYEIREKQ